MASRSPFIVSRKLPVLAHTGTIIATLKMIAVVCSAIGTINIYARDEWLNALNSLTACFKKRLKGLQEDIVQ